MRNDGHYAIATRKPTASPPRTAANWMAARPELPLCLPGCTADEPRVGVGTGPFARFVAADDRAANPTDGGLNRYTETTFLRNVSPMIQSGVPAPVWRANNEPAQVVDETCIPWKSDGLTFQNWPLPN